MPLVFLQHVNLDAAIDEATQIFRESIVAVVRARSDFSPVIRLMLMFILRFIIRIWMQVYLYCLHGLEAGLIGDALLVC